MVQRRNAIPSARRGRLPIFKGLEVLGDPWNFLIMQESFLGVRRFDDFQRNLRIARSILTDRLNFLIGHDLLRKVRYHRKPARYEYRLTPRGLDSYPYAVMLMKWGDEWLERREGSFVQLHHLTCGAVLRPQCVCGECGGEAAAVTVSIDPATVFRASATEARMGYSSKPELYAQGRETSVSETLALMGDR